jgi:hypothetical protein
MSQSEAMYKRLCDLYGADMETRIEQNMDQLDGGHDDILRSNEYVNIVKDFILGDAR